MFLISIHVSTFISYLLFNTCRETRDSNYSSVLLFLQLIMSTAHHAAARKRSLPKRSFIHNFFVKCPNVVGKSQCVSCGAVLTCNAGGTSTLRKHLQAKHAEDYTKLIDSEAESKRSKVRYFLYCKNLCCKVFFDNC